MFISIHPIVVGEKAAEALRGSIHGSKLRK
jgi:hypothetical protein